MLIGYMRPYQDDPSCEDQMKLLTIKNCEMIVQEEHSSAKKRTKLNQLLLTIKEDDKVIVTKLFALADSTRHLVEIMDALKQKKASLTSIHEGIDTSNPLGYAFEDILTKLVDFQSDVISEKTKKGITEAKEKGVATGRPRKPDENVQRAIVMYESKKYTLAEIKEKTGISKSTLYRYLES